MMDKFRVGQKVRIIKVVHCKELLGVVCEVTEQRKWHLNTLAETWYGYSVNLISDALGIGLCTVHPTEDSLEPVSDGDNRSSWSECAWKPNPKLIEYHDKTTKKEKV
jgi:hypothetical protein